ncbi:MAG: nitrogenase-stabilizing/protective protein NifW [Gammaproteobacteria bacterium]|nr:nitrogenase-stabilizing/protective protein NifW [Gammaproteobacteria bacterium]
MSPSPETALNSRLGTLSAAEEFFDFFAVRYEQHVVNVSRLHILKRYRQYLDRAGDLAALDADTLVATHRECLSRAHADFTRSSGVQEKVFKVFQQAEGRQHVTVDALRASLSSQKRD